jgi:hypothetical protein
MNRRTFMTRGGGALLGLAGGGTIYHALAQERNQAQGMLSRPQRDRIQESLHWLSQQQAADGSFGTGAYQGNAAVTSLAGLAFMAGGNQPGRGQFGANVTNAVRYILTCETTNGPNAGFINSRRSASHGPMYGHGFATLFLAEVYGMVNDQALRTQLRATLGRAIQLIIRSQNNEGGWRYQPRPADADLSVTICQIMALRAARNAGISVPADTARRCTEYVKRCQDPNSGGFKYQAGGHIPGGVGFARTAAGVVALYSAGEYTGPAVDKGLDYLKTFRPNAAGGFFNENVIHYHYGHYYAVQAAWIKGGAYWSDWFPRIRDELFASRLQNGSWSMAILCPHYCTAMSLIILQVPYNYLPILQR